MVLALKSGKLGRLSKKLLLEDVFWKDCLSTAYFNSDLLCTNLLGINQPVFYWLCGWAGLQRLQ